MSAELPLNWRALTVAELRQWIRDSGYEMPYMLYAKKDHLVRWIEQNASLPRCPTCGRPT